MNIQKLILLCLIYIPITCADTLVGKVVGITDGDSITVLDNSKTQHKIRLAGIDAPEKKQAFGNASKETLSSLIYQEQVSVEWIKEDRYNRKVGKVLLRNTDINLEQIKLGMAWRYKKYIKELELQDRLDYLHAEEAARAGKVGLWQDANPIPPWEFRKQEHSQSPRARQTNQRVSLG